MLELYAPEIDKTSVQGLVKTDLHVHAETTGRLTQAIRRRQSQARPSHRDLIDRTMVDWEPGLGRLLALSQGVKQRCNELTGRELAELCEQPDHVEALLEELMEEEAAEGSVLAEIRMGGGWPFFPHYVACFRAAERRVQARHPRFHAEPIIAWGLTRDPSLLEAEVRHALLREGIAGIDLYPEYRYWDYETLYGLAKRAANAGLGVTCHEGEFGVETLRQMLDLPGLTRLGHATQAYKDPTLLAELVRRDIVVEVSLTSNVVTGAVRSLADHPIRRFLDAGVRVTLCADDPVMFDTTIGREYAIARLLGFSDVELRQFARNGIEASFTSPERRARLLSYLA